VLDISVNTGSLVWKPEGARELLWQFDTWSAQGLWFWRQKLPMRSTAAILAEMADVVSKNGNYLLNVTPDPEGVITPSQVSLLSEIGDWLKINGEAIYGSQPWKVYGEGPTSGLGPSFRPNVPLTPYQASDIRFTRKGETLYAIVLAPPEGKPLTIRSLASGSPQLDRKVEGVSLLGSDSPVKSTLTEAGLVVDLAGQKLNTLPLVLRILGKRQ
jgi:alpha-L-fucosidase